MQRRYRMPASVREVLRRGQQKTPGTDLARQRQFAKELGKFAAFVLFHAMINGK